MRGHPQSAETRAKISLAWQDSRLRYCLLAGWRHDCGGGLHGHHLINLSRLRSLPMAKLLVERRWRTVFIVDCCGQANISRLADTKEGRAILLRGRIAELGRGYVDQAFEELARLMKSSPPTIDAILSRLPEDAPPVW